MKETTQQQGKEKENVGESQQPQSQQAGFSPSQTANVGTSPAQSPQQSQTNGESSSQAQRELTGRERFALSHWGDSSFTMMRRFSEEMDRFRDRVFEDFGMGRSWLASRFGRGGERGHSMWSPQVEIYERENHLVICADLPGLKKDNIKVEFKDNVLTIQGERQQEYEEKQQGYQRSERSYGSFYRAIPLPEGIDAGKVQATFQDGVLKITMPMPQQEERRGRRIEIQGGGEPSLRS
jgi:HSP20 family protein